MTIAGALDSGKVKITDSFDARFGVRFGRFTIDDFHGKHRILTRAGNLQILVQRRHHPRHAGAGARTISAPSCTKVGFDEPVPLELPERRNPVVPKKFSEIVAATASFGHGLSVSPLHMAARHGGVRQRRHHGHADALQDAA